MNKDVKRILLLTVAVVVAQILTPGSSLVAGKTKLARERHTVQVRGTHACGKTTLHKLVVNKLLHTMEKPVVRLTVTVLAVGIGT